MTDLFGLKRTFFSKVLFNTLLVALTAAFFSSCVTSRPSSSYFRNIPRDTTITVINNVDKELMIKSGDVLTISFSSLSKEEDQLFIMEANPGYEVSKDGDIYIQRLGKVTAKGLTRKQLKIKLEADLKPYLKNPLVSINFANHHVTLIGEVGSPQVIPLPEERITIIDILAKGGKTSETILLSDVVVIRDSSATQKKIKHLNLEDHSVFASEYYYLQPDDVVVVNANEKLVQDDRKRLKYQQVSSIVLQTITIGLVIYQTFFRN